MFTVLKLLPAMRVQKFCSSSSIHGAVKPA